MRCTGDVSAWVELRERAVADLTPRPRSWLHADYAAEMFDRDRGAMRAELVGVSRTIRPPRIVGAVTLAIRSRPGGPSAGGRTGCSSIRDWRRRGVGNLLLAHLEQTALDAGYREVQLETHTGWAAAVAFYHSIGYAPVRDAAPRCGLSIFTRPSSIFTRPAASSLSTCG